MFIGRYDAKAEIPVLWPPHVKSWLIGEDFDAGRDWGQEKGTTEDEMTGWQHWYNTHGFGWTPGVGDGQGCLACCNSWGRKESDTTEWLNWTELARRPINILPSFSDKCLSTRRLICLKSVVLPKVWCHSQKALNKVTFLHSKDTIIYNNERSTVIYNKEKIH